MTRDTKATTLAAIAVLSWSTVATAFKIALSRLTYFEMLLVASLTALVIFTTWMTIARKWPKLRLLDRRTWAYFAMFGLLNPVCYYLLLFKAYELLPAQVAQPLNYIWPIMLLVLIAAFRRQPIPARKYIGMAISLAGVVFISVGGQKITGGLSVAGVSLALFSALLWALYWMLNDRIKNTVDECVSLFLGFLFGSIYMCVAACFMPLHNLGSIPGILSGIYIGAFEIGVPFICFGMALRATSNPALINQMCYLSPFLSLLFIGIILGESIATATYVGLLLIVAGIIYNRYFAAPSGRPDKTKPSIEENLQNSSPD